MSEKATTHVVGVEPMTRKLASICIVVLDA
jgi:hypothetical protein